MTIDELFRQGTINAERGPVFEQEPLPVQVDFSSVWGMMLGLAIGDALGNT